jgi:hypothetical protein
MTDNLLNQYSSQVELYFDADDGTRWSVAQVWGDGCILRDHPDFTPRTGRLVVIVDGVEEVKHVYIHTFDAESREAKFF